MTYTGVSGFDLWQPKASHVPGSDKLLAGREARKGDDSLHVPMHQQVLAGATQDGIVAVKVEAQGHASILRHGEDLDWGCRTRKGPQANAPAPCASQKHLLVGAVA